MSEVVAPADGGQGAGASATSAAVLTPTPGHQVVNANDTSTGAIAAPPPPPQPANPTIDWLKGADETTLGYTANKGWKDPAEVVRSYQNLEKLLGADKAGNAIVVPKPDADPKEWAAVYDKLGRPTGPDGYKVPVPEGGNKEFQDSMLKVAHDLGLTKSQAEGLFGKYNEATMGMAKAQAEAKMAAFQQDDAAIKQEWGAAYTQNLAQAQAAARVLGLDSATIDKLSDALGHKGTMQLLQKIGSKAAEADFVDGGSDKPGFSSVMSPAQAKSEIRELSQDRGFTAKLLAKDAQAMQRWSQLHDWAYPQEQR